MFNSSVVSYPNRGHYGNSAWRGNTSGEIIKDFLTLSHKNKNDLFSDPASGSCSSKDVATEMGIRYIGLDLYAGFNLLKDDLGSRLGEKAGTIFFHPPYHNMVKYSGNVWGPKGIAHPDDLSQCPTVEDFLSKMQLALMNIYDALKSNASYAVLIGDMRKNGEFIPLSDLTRTLCPGKNLEKIIKIQHNCFSDRTIYATNNFIPIKHEVMYIFKKTTQSFLSYANELSNYLSKTHTATWRNVVIHSFIRCNNKELSLQEIYSIVEKSTDKIANNKNWQAKIRQVLQNERYFVRVSIGVYKPIKQIA